MSDQTFDDSLLDTSESMAGVDWDNMESFGAAAEGDHLANIVSVKGYTHDFKDYTGPRAKVKFVIKDGPDKGKFVYDDINLPHPQEKEGNVKRRALIASRMGLIPKGTKETVNIKWKALEGRDVLITVVHRYGEKEGKKTGPFANVEWAGWAAPGSKESSAPATAGYPDI